MKKTEKFRKIPKDELTLKSEVTLNRELSTTSRYRS